MIDTQMSEAELWQKIQLEVNNMADEEPTLRGFLQASVLGHNRLGPALAKLLADKLQSVPLPAELLAGLFESSFADPDATSRRLSREIRPAVVPPAPCFIIKGSTPSPPGVPPTSSGRMDKNHWRRPFSTPFQPPSVLIYILLQPLAKALCLTTPRALSSAKPP